METVSRFVELVDRKTGASIGFAFAETEDDMRRADEALNAMSPPEDSGMRRTGVEIYEVALDELLARPPPRSPGHTRAGAAFTRATSRAARGADRHPVGECRPRPREGCRGRADWVATRIKSAGGPPRSSRGTVGAARDREIAASVCADSARRSSATRTSTRSLPTRSTSGSRRLSSCRARRLAVRARRRRRQSASVHARRVRAPARGGG